MALGKLIKTATQGGGGVELEPLSLSELPLGGEPFFLSELPLGFLEKALRETT